MIPGATAPPIVAAAQLLFVIAAIYVLVLVTATVMVYVWFRLATWRDRLRF